MSGRPSWNLEPCGTIAAYRRHRRKGQPACQRCKDANALARAERKERKARAAADAARRFTAEAREAAA